MSDLAPNYRQVLNHELKRRIHANNRYSMRSFASTLGISPAFLSKILRAQKNLSLEKAVQLCGALDFTPAETQNFCASVRNLGTGDSLSPLLEKTEIHPVSALSLEAFELISDWYHYAILVLTECRHFNADPGAIGERLGISALTAEAAIQRMLRLGVLEKARGRLKKAKTYVATPSETASKALRTFHKQMMEKAIQALEQQDVTERDITGVTLAIHPERLAEAKIEIRNFRRRMAKLLDTGRPSSVYQLNIQLFRLSKEKII